MVENNVLKFVKNQKGQAIFEMILFLPFLLFLYTIYYTAGNSISGSINQQKAVRGYLYNLIKGNSYIVNLNELKSFSGAGLKKVGFNSVGWNEKLEGGKNSFAPCFKFSSLLKNGSTEECDSSEREEEDSSRFIRLFTYYGVCGPTYIETTDIVSSNPYYDIPPNGQTQINSCHLENN
jgi:hypothetical protein